MSIEESTESDSIDLTQPNSHYVQNVMNLADSHEIVASEDVFDSRGTKLIAKGARVDQGLHDRLLRFKLRKPLEVSLTVNDGLNPQKLLAEAEAMLDQIPPLSNLLQPAVTRREVMSTIKDMKLGRVSTLLASMEGARLQGPCNHSILAVVTSLGIGVRLGIDSSLLPNLAIASLLHDVGELYINPEYRTPGHILTPTEWKHIAAHPRIGQLVIQETTSLPQSVATAIAEHHERPNGFGYPGRLDSKELSPLGQILLVSEVLCGILSKTDNALERACLAVKVIPGEYPKDIVSLVATIRQKEDSPASAPPGEERTEQIIARAKRINQIIDTTHLTLDKMGNPASAAAKLHDRIRERIVMLQRAVHATGLSECIGIGSLSSGDMASLALEIETVFYEIEWRLRELARQVSLAIDTFPADQQAKFELVVTALSPN